MASRLLRLRIWELVRIKWEKVSSGLSSGDGRRVRKGAGVPGCLIEWGVPLCQRWGFTGVGGKQEAEVRVGQRQEDLESSGWLVKDAMRDLYCKTLGM